MSDYIKCVKCGIRFNNTNSKYFKFHTRCIKKLLRSVVHLEHIYDFRLITKDFYDDEINKLKNILGNNFNDYKTLTFRDF